MPLMVLCQGLTTQRGLDQAVEPGHGVLGPASLHWAPWRSQAWPWLCRMGSQHGLLGHEGAPEAVLALAGSPFLPTRPIRKNPWLDTGGVGYVASSAPF